MVGMNSYRIVLSERVHRELWLVGIGIAVLCLIQVHLVHRSDKLFLWIGQLLLQLLLVCEVGKLHTILNSCQLQEVHIYIYPWLLVVLREYQYAIFERHQPLAMVEGVVVYHAHYASLFDTCHMIEHMLRSLETLMASSIFVLWPHKCAQSLGACHQLNCHDMILIHHPAILREHIFGLLFSAPLGCLWFLVYKYVKVCHFPVIHIVQILQLLILIIWGHLVILFVICMLLCLYKTHHLFAEKSGLDLVLQEDNQYH